MTALVLLSHEKLGIRLSEFRTMCLYPVVAIYIIIYVRTHSQVDRIERLVMRMFVFVAAFACFQFVFRNDLPMWLLVSDDTHAFGYAGTDIVRATALMGNTIVFATVMSLGYTLHLARFVEHPSFSRFLSTGVIFFGGLVTFSRVAIAVNCVITVVIPMVAWFRRRPAEATVGSIISLLALLLTVATFNAAGVSSEFAPSFLASGVFGNQNRSAAESWESHLHLLQIAQQTISENLWTGIGIGTQNIASIYSESHIVVTDGGILALLMEGGLLLGVPYLGMLFLVTASLLNSARLNQRNWQAIGLGVFSLSQLFFADIVNSGFWGKGPFILFWIMFGLICARRRLEQLEAALTPSSDLAGPASAIPQPLNRAHVPSALSERPS